MARDEALVALKEHFMITQNRMKKMVDQNRRELVLEVRDKVF